MAPSAAARRALLPLALLGLLYAAMAVLPAAPGSRLVLATVGGSPGWLLGPLAFGGSSAAAAGAAGPLFLVALAASLALYAAVLVGAEGLPRRVAAAAIALAHLLFLLAPPLLSQDVFSYLAYARLGALHGLDPYVSPPLAAPEDPVFAFAGSKGAPSVYGPLFTLILHPLGHLDLVWSYWGLKVGAAASSLGTAAIVWRSAERLGRDPRRAALAVGLNPLVLVHVVAAAHNEALVALVGTAGLAAWLGGRALAGGLLAAAGAGLKASAGLLAPFLVAGARSQSTRRRAALGVALGTAGVVLAAAVGPAAGAVEALGTLFDNQRAGSSGSFPRRTAELLALLLPVRVEGLRAGVSAAFALAFAGVALLALRSTWRGADAITMAAWATVAALVASSWLVPWYVMWVLPLAALSEDVRPLVAATVLSAWMLPIAVPL